MTKLEVGMWVRIKNKSGWCCIGKIYNINDFREPSMKYCIDIQSDDFVFIPEDMITKASHNIIDLIEVGDYVNGKLVSSLPLFKNEFIFDEPVNGVKYIKGVVGTPIEDNKDNFIKTIVTKEQFESMEYKIGE